MNNLEVKIDDKIIGNLSKENDEYVFTYKTQDKNAFLSLTMPVREKSWVSKKLHPIFDMNLPQGHLLSMIEKRYAKVQKIDKFGLLKYISPYCKGRITYEANYIEEKIFSLDDIIFNYDESFFKKLINRFGLISPISGVLPKVQVVAKDKNKVWAQEYIVKSWDNNYNEIALNEYICMSVAKKAQIPTPDFFISENRKLFMVGKFNKKDDGTYLGFEDICVLQGKNSKDKYNGSYEGIAKTIKTFVSPKNKKESLKNYYKMVVVNFLLKNGDAHLKNFGLIYDDLEDIRLAPIYDIATTTFYTKDDIPALSLYGSRQWVKKETILKFGVEFCDLDPKEAKDLYEICFEAKNVVLENVRTARL